MLALIAMSINRKRRAVRKVTYFSSKTAPEPTDKSCNICLDIVHSTDSRGRLPVCSHYYCYTCIFEWSKIANECPCCKKTFRCITKVSDCSPERKVRIPDVVKEDGLYEGHDTSFDEEESVISNDSFVVADDSNSEWSSTTSISTECTSSSSSDECFVRPKTACTIIMKRKRKGGWFKRKAGSVFRRANVN